MAGSEERYKEALKGKQVPVLTLDNKWHKLFGRVNATKEIEKLEKELNGLLKRQGKLTNEIRDLKRVKNNLLTDIMSNMDGIEQDTDASVDKKLNDNKRLVNEVNEKVESHEDELLEIPHEIDRVNRELMLKTMELCYHKLTQNTDEIEEIAKWIGEMRIALKTNIIKKQDKEINNSDLYGYMHNIFGQSAIELFDMRYEPTLPSERKKNEKEKMTEEITKE